MKLVTFKTVSGIEFSFNPNHLVALVENKEQNQTEIHLSENLTFFVQESIKKIKEILCD